MVNSHFRSGTLFWTYYKTIWRRGDFSPHLVLSSDLVFVKLCLLGYILNSPFTHTLNKITRNSSIWSFKKCISTEKSNCSITVKNPSMLSYSSLWGQAIFILQRVTFCWRISKSMGNCARAGRRRPGAIEAIGSCNFRPGYHLKISMV